MSEKKEIEPKPDDVDELDIPMPDQSYAKAFDRLSHAKGRALQILSNLASRKDIARYQLAFNVGMELGANYKWLVQWGEDGLALSCGVKARGREGVERAIVANVERKEGVGTKLKDFLAGDRGK